MERLHYEVKINAPVNAVYTTMLGLKDKSTYEQWTALFNPTSSYDGRWDKGSRIKFVGVDDEGKKGGMLSEIIENNPNTFVSIRHIGLIDGDREITEGPEVEKWTGGYENYTFEEADGGTLVKVDVDTTEEFVGHMDESYPKALDHLKYICEH